MRVKVIPNRPIPGLLPKNAMLTGEACLDLNKREILYCMNFGNVFDEEGTVIDHKYLSEVFYPTTPKRVVKPETATQLHKESSEEHVVNKPDDEEVYEHIHERMPNEPIMSTSETEAMLNLIKETVIPAEEETVVEEPAPVTEEVSTVGEEPAVEESEEPVADDEVVPKYELEVVSCTRYADAIELATQFVSNVEKITGEFYGLFNILSGARPASLEYLVEGGDISGWVKFNNKFANLSEIENGTKFRFRFIPKNDSKFAYRISIKENNEVVVKLDGEVNPSEL